MTTLAIFGVLALAVIWGGYPLAVRALGGLRRRRGPAPLPTPPGVSVILATCEDAGAIRARVEDVLRATYPADRLEVIVALDVSRARARPSDLAGLDSRVLVVAAYTPTGKAAALNAAVRVAHHDVLVFTDTAQRFAPDAIAALVEAMRDPALGAVSGQLELGVDGGRPAHLAERYWRYERWLRRWEARLHSSVGVTGAIYAMRRSLWHPLPRGLILDDLYVPMRLVLHGWRVGFVDRARALDARRFAPGQEYRRKVRTLTGVIQLCVWMPAVLHPLRNPIWAQFVCHKLLRLLTPYFAALALLGAAGAAVAALLAHPFEALRLLAAGVTLGIAVATSPRARRAVRSQIAWGIALQSSTVMATVHGVRGRWDVWQ